MRSKPEMGCDGGASVGEEDEVEERSRSSESRRFVVFWPFDLEEEADLEEVREVVDMI